MDTRNSKYVTAYIGLGSNLGDREKNISRALNWLAEHARIEIIANSENMETEPWGLLDQPAFMNAVIKIRTDLSPEELLVELKRAEAELGRKFGRVKWGPREIDLDILLYSDRVIDSKELTIPHPHILDRPFIISQILKIEPLMLFPRSKTLLVKYL